MGVTIVKAKRIRTAIEIAKSDRVLENGGTVRVSQVTDKTKPSL